MPATEPPRAPVRPRRQPSGALGHVPPTAAVEVRFAVPGPMQAGAVAALGDVRDADARRVNVLDTPTLALERHGVAVRLRRGGAGGDETAVSVRPLLLGALGPEIAAAPGFAVAVDASGGGWVCSGSLAAPAAPGRVVDVLHGHRPASHVLTAAQRAFLVAHAPAGIAIDDLVVSGPGPRARPRVRARRPRPRDPRGGVAARGRPADHGPVGPLHGGDGRRGRGPDGRAARRRAAQGPARRAGSSAAAGSGCAPSSLKRTSISCRSSCRAAVAESRSTS